MSLPTLCKFAKPFGTKGEGARVMGNSITNFITFAMTTGQFASGIMAPFHKEIYVVTYSAGKHDQT